MTAKAFVRRVPSARSGLWAAKAPALTRLDIELTERCNNDCLHCSVNRPAGDAEARSREWPAARWRALLDEAAALGCLVVRFTGGEPLLRDDFAEIYLHARRRGLRIMLFTNAALVTDETAALLARVPPLEAVEVSVYGMTEATCEAVTRARGSFAAARRGLGRLLDAGVAVAVKGAVLPPTRGEVEAFEAWAAGLPGQSGPPPLVTLLDLRSRRDGDKSAAIAALRPTADEFVRLARRRGDAVVGEWREFVARSGGPPGDRLFTCHGPGGSAAVDPYGRLQLCLGLRHPAAVYDLSGGSLREAVTEFLPRLREARATDPAYLARCAKCFLKGLCQQCPAKSWAEHGTLDTPVEYFCGVAHAQAVAAGLLERGEKAWTVGDPVSRTERRTGP
ncbi:MAG: radical SAM protein [Candidatus Aminicenantes bacterium]|nr:radical SAM protein [Candidatus Aminicenantes bacterium]NLH76551.1 radical SAM protein [Acidobacteriota bacterium]